jgi:ABC-type Fe3+/spermidine/putrescine transport system ATPase subunit
MVFQSYALYLHMTVAQNIGPEFLVYAFHPQGQIVVRTSEEPTGDCLNHALDPGLKSNAFALERICA